mmetsp:Transcript_32482/g.74662  ORF Transcript_32482/g.74662 Transcript_32482/m.74662 type:complete len:150 (-) Transcript_32482:1463-1912(-)|eukprot:CAMPEP_0116826238 /NCGR_PEP_ID=MMETSP0418-20121206/2422_1 /TAXON_ID=1158023 /ORGANISM="Astrosyne radiata, Strain 13vi08-1A" /LENGTH=149 /DNA_ID=CAMNT_0004454859 /DNA_START=81 /DNA_END=530 /DNA_ORIENTATION=-
MPKSATFGRVLAVSALAGGAETFAPNAFGVRSSSTGLAAVASDDAALSRGRRKALHSSLCICATCVGTSAAVALDMDSFANSQLEADKKNCDPKVDPKCVPKLSSDEALCKYGQNGNARAEACKRVKAAGGKVPDAGSQGKSLGGAYAM